MILIISSPDDVHAQAVTRELERRGVNDARILNLSDFPLRMDVSMRLDNNGTSDFALRFPDGKRVGMDEVTAVWWRRPQPFVLPPQLSLQHRYFAMTEAATSLQGMWQATADHALWINDIHRDAAAAHKPYQLALAKCIGLTIPETLITNSPEEAKAFWDEHGDDVIYKIHTAQAGAWRETRKLKREERALADQVRLAPVIFQKFVPAVADLRVTAIGGRLFPAATDVRTIAYPLDVRMNGAMKYEPHTLPADVEHKLLKLMQQLGLEYGAIDLRLTPEGEYVFLEVNPAGQFLYVEMSARIELAAALAEHLMSAAPAVPPVASH